MNSYAPKLILAIALLTGQTLQGQLVKQTLDLEGKGNLVEVELPFSYYHRTNEPCSLIYQGGYKLFDVAQDAGHLVIIGTLQPCIGIVVTDGQKVIAFHKHWSNKLEHLAALIKEHLDTSNLRARIYTARNDEVWSRCQFSYLHKGKSHMAEVKRIQDFLCNTLGLPRENVVAQMHNLRIEDGSLRYPDRYLAQYEIAELCVAIQLSDLFEADGSIKFYTIDLVQADIYSFKQDFRTNIDKFRW